MGPQSGADSSANEKRTSRDLGAATPYQKPTPPASKVVEDFCAHSPSLVCMPIPLSSFWGSRRLVFVSFLRRMAPQNSLATFTPVMGCPGHCGALFFNEKVTMSDTNTAQAGHETSLTIAREVRFSRIFFSPATRSSRHPFSVPAASADDITCAAKPPSTLLLRASASGHAPPGIRLRHSARPSLDTEAADANDPWSWWMSLPLCLRHLCYTLAGRFLSPSVVVWHVVVRPRALRSSSHRDER